MRSRLLAVLTAVTGCLGTALVAAPAAQAWSYAVLPMCSGSVHTLCVVSATRNGVTANTETDAANAPDGVPTEWYYVDNGWRDGVFGFNLNTKTNHGSTSEDSKSVDASATWAITVNTGSSYPREIDAKTRNTVFTTGGNPTTGYWFTIQFNPVPVAWRYFDPSFTCDMTACGNDGTLADFVSTPGKGFADGYVTDLADSPSPAYVSARTGMVLAGNAQYQAEPSYDAGTNSLLVQMANPHLSSPGVPASGFFEAFLPNAYLTSQLGVPDPASLSGATFSVLRDGSTTSTAFALTHTSTGIWIRVHDIGFSRPTFRLHPGPSAPRRISARKVSAHKARVSFRKPASTLGHRINRYQARCQKPGRVWRTTKGTASPLTVGSLPTGRVICQVRAHNRLGWGAWSAARHT